MDRAALAERVAERCWLRGQFHLRSGRISDIYFDKYRFESDPVLLAATGRHLLPLVPADCEVLAGIELGGVPIATALSLIRGLPVSFVRKTAKSYATRACTQLRACPVQVAERTPCAQRKPYRL